MTGPARKALAKRNEEIALRVDRGEHMLDLAAEYGVSRVTVWRAANAGMAAVLPDTHEREAWRRELMPTLARAIEQAGSQGDHANLTRLSDRLAKLLGLDHSDQMAEREVRVAEAQATVIIQAVTRAIEAADLDPDAAARIQDTIAGELEEAE